MTSGKKQQGRKSQETAVERKKRRVWKESGSSNRQCLPGKNPLKSLKTFVDVQS